MAANTAAYALSWRLKNPERHKLINRRSRVKSRFGITLDQYYQLMAQQESKCKICGKFYLIPSQDSPDYGRRFLRVDHDHRCCPGKESCGKCIRGLLCDLCNKGIGHFNDDPNLLIAASSYLSDKMN